MTTLEYSTESATTVAPRVVLEEGLNAERLGFDLIGTTMNGYTPYTEGQTTSETVWF